MQAIAMVERTVPTTLPDDDDDVVVALETARVSEERSDLEAASKWLHRAAAAARRQGRPERAGTLSRCAAQVWGTDKFEKKPNDEQVLEEISEDDFAESTIVETAEEIASKSVEDSTQSSSGPDSIVVDKPTPVAPLTVQPRLANEKIRVAVKQKLGGGFEARPLAEGEKAAEGESEAFLVPIPTS